VILSYPLVISEWAKTRYPTKASSLTSWERQSAAGLLAMLVARFFRRQNLDQVRSIHWLPYDRVGVVNADP
jgi:hypothetical protein